MPVPWAGRPSRERGGMCGAVRTDNVLGTDARAVLEQLADPG